MRPHATLFLWLILGLNASAGAPAPTEEGKARAEALYNQALGSAPRDRIAPLTEALQLCPNDVRYWIALGDAYGTPTSEPAPAGGDPPPAAPLDATQARKVYEQAARFAPASPLPYLRLAETVREADPRAAAAYLDKAIALDPEDALPLYSRALLHFQAAEDERGCRCLERARQSRRMRFPVLMPTAPLPMEQATQCMAHQSFAFLAMFRELARQIVRVASDTPPGPTAGPRVRGLLLDGERLAYRIMKGEPPCLIALLVALAVGQVVDTPTRFFLLGRGDAAGLAAFDARRKAREALRRKAQDLAAGLPTEMPAPGERVWVLRKEGEAVLKLVAESGLSEPPTQAE